MIFPVYIGAFQEAGGVSYLLDLYGTDAEAAYSLRRVGDSSYSGGAIRIREDSGNTETDIGFVGEDLDTAAIASHCGANNGYIVTWYDQTGNGNDLTQSTTANQPLIYNGSAVTTDNEGNVAIEPDNSNDILSIATDPITGTTNRTEFVVCSTRDDLNAQRFYGNDSGFLAGDRWRYTTSNVGAGTNEQFISGRISNAQGNENNIATNDVWLGTVLFNGTQFADIAFWKNGVSSTGATGSAVNVNTNSGQFNVPEDATNGNIYISELIRYSAAKTTDRAAIESNIMAYWTTT